MGRTLQIPIANAYLPFLQPSRYKGAYGGRGSAKSHEFANLLVERVVLNPGTRWVCVREIQKTLEHSCKQLLEDKIKLYQLGDSFIIKHTHIETPGDGVIIFQGMQDHNATSIKSLEGFDGAWVEEAQTLSSTSLTLLRPTIRKEDSELWFTWNPSEPTDAVDEFLRKDPPPDSIVVRTGWEDNPFFPTVLRKEMEWDLSKDPEKYQHVWGGGYERRANARVFKNWRVEEFETPKTAHFLTGADWGFSVDPSSLVRCYEERIDPKTGIAHARKRIYIDHDLYRIGVEIDHLPEFFDGLVCGCEWPRTGPCKQPDQHGAARRLPIIADSSRPDTISYLRRHGYTHMEAAKKGPNSVKEGVIFLQGYDIIIHPRCIHTKDEFTHYSYVVNTKVEPPVVTNVLEDKKNHIIDPVRYAVEQLRGQLKIRPALWG